MEEAGIVAFAFGLPGAIAPNQRIAKIISHKARELGVPVYTQIGIVVDSGIEVEYIQGNRPPTLRIARGAVQWAKRRGIKTLWIIAAKQHLWRCIRDLTRASREIKSEITLRVCKEVEQFSEDEWFCRDSTLRHARSRKDWQCRDFILKLMPFFLYKRIAK